MDRVARGYGRGTAQLLRSGGEARLRRLTDFLTPQGGRMTLLGVPVADLAG